MHQTPWRDRATVFFACWSARVARKEEEPKTQAHTPRLGHLAPGRSSHVIQGFLLGFAEGVEVDAELLALFVEVAAFEAEGAGDVGHVEIVAADFGEEGFTLEGFGAFDESALRGVGRMRRAQTEEFGGGQGEADVVSGDGVLRWRGGPGARRCCAVRGRCRARSSGAVRRWLRAAKSFSFQPFCAATWRAKWATRSGISSGRSRSGGRSQGENVEAVDRDRGGIRFS